MHYIYGINSVTEALKARGRAFEWIGMAKERHDIRLQRLIEDCRRLGVQVRFLERTELDKMAGNAGHQGVVAVTSAKQYNDLDDVISAKRAEYSLIVVLDGVEDPHNLGAILRTADAAGANGIVIPERRSASVTGTVTKVSAGASEHMPIAKVTNIARTVEELKEHNVWTVGLDERAKQTYDALDYNMDCALVLGGEGKGLHDLVKRKCDFLVSIPMLGKVPSLNVSVAAAVVLFEIVRQRRARNGSLEEKMKFLEMTFPYKGLGFLCVLCASLVNCFSLDREAFTFTSYDLNVQVEPEQHRLGVRGKLTLRNDTATPQKIAVLQISSSLDWRSIKAADKPLQFLSQPYTSDIDHTGALSEAIVTLPQPVSPQATIELEIAYEGVILLDATRLTRIGTPEESANSTDWDQIGPNFTAVRGAGYVAWYPIATEVANLSEGNSLFEALGRWRARESASKMQLHVKVSTDDVEGRPELVINNPSCFLLYENAGRAQLISADCTYQPLGLLAPLFVVANYGFVDRTSIVVYDLPTHAVAAESYASVAEKAVSLITDWFGAPREKAKTADLPDPKATPFESGSLLLTPLAASDSKLAGLSAAHQLTHAAFVSFRPWIEEGLAHFAQALYLEQQSGRTAALEYMGLHRSALSEVEAPSALPRSEDDANRSLVNTTNEELYRSKAMCVWWMLRDMVGEPALEKAIAAYRPELDKEPSYMPRLIAAQTQHDLEWFFDDWVYRDRGLPDFKIESAFSRKTMTGSFMLTVTLDNLGTAGAEVPIIVKFSGGEIMRRLEVRAKNKAVIRVEVPAAPQEIVVNDGSVPESNTANNNFKIVEEAK